MLKIIEHFKIVGRGTVIVLDDFTGLPVGALLHVVVHQGNGKVAKFDAHKEWFLKKDRDPVEVEAFALPDAEVADIPIGCTVEISVKDG